jgi:hypothetical protein
MQHVSPDVNKLLGLNYAMEQTCSILVGNLDASA